MIPEPPPWVLGALLVAATIFILLMLIVGAFSHESYPSWCCNGDGTHGDCKPIACDSVTETKDGYEWSGFHFTANQTMPSFDRQCHACVTPSQNPTCLFILPSS